MKILHISEAFGGGLRSAIVNYVQAAGNHEHHLFVRTRIGHETFDIPDSAAVTVYDGHMRSFLVEARRFVLENDFDVVHLHSSYAGVLRAVLPAGTRIVYSPHCYATEADHPLVKRAVYWAVEKVLARREQMLMAVSPREAMIGHRLNHDMPSRQVPNAATPMPATAATPTDFVRPTVVMLGRIAAQKDPKFFADVAATVGRSVCDFVWIGEGDEGREHLDRAGVRITGWLTPEATRQVLQSADLYLHTAGWEGGPLSTLEAVEMGCPVLSRSIPSMVSLGYPLAGGTPAEAASTVERFFADPAYREQIRLDGKEVNAANTFARMSVLLGEAYEFAGARLGRPVPRRSSVLPQKDPVAA